MLPIRAGLQMMLGSKLSRSSLHRSFPVGFADKYGGNWAMVSRRINHFMLRIPNSLAKEIVWSKKAFVPCFSQEEIPESIKIPPVWKNKAFCRKVDSIFFPYLMQKTLDEGQHNLVSLHYSQSGNSSLPMRGSQFVWRIKLIYSKTENTSFGKLIKVPRRLTGSKSLRWWTSCLYSESWVEISGNALKWKSTC